MGSHNPPVNIESSICIQCGNLFNGARSPEEDDEEDDEEDAAAPPEFMYTFELFLCHLSISTSRICWSRISLQ